MNIFSVLSLLAFASYLLIGVNALKLEPKQRINRLFLTLCVSMAIWSFAYAFVYVSPADHSFWIKISAIGWCSYSALALHITLLFTKNKALDNHIVLPLIYSPGFIFFGVSTLMFWPNQPTPPPIVNFFYIGDFLYNFSYDLLCIYLIYRWGKKSDDLRKKKQAAIIAYSALVPFILNFMSQYVLPVFGIDPFPLMGQIYSLITFIGIYWAVIKYRLFTITADLFNEKVMSEMMDLVILVSPEGNIIKVNKHLEELLGFEKHGLISKPISTIIHDQKILNLLTALPASSSFYKFNDMYCIKKDGSPVPVSITCSLIIDSMMKDFLGMVIVGQDITIIKELEQEVMVRKEAEERILYMANHDNLTNLPNRKFFYENLNHKLNKKESQESFAVLFLDLDNFKGINDLFGHDAGDFVLCEIGKRLKTSVRNSDFVARIGGDEFLVILSNVSGYQNAEKISEYLLQVINTPITWNKQPIQVEASIGISLYPDDGITAKQLVNKADRKMYLLKHDSRAI